MSTSKRSDEGPVARTSSSSDSDYGTPVGGVQSRIWVEEATYEVGDPVVVHYAIRNVGESEVTIWHSGFWPNHRIEVTNSDGKAVPLTPLGEQVRSMFSPAGVREKNAPKTLLPGDEDDSWQSYDLSQYVDLTESGDYNVVYIYHDSQSDLSGPVVSNELAIRILPRS